ncbi:MAG: helix-turn-helix domain-containing protein [Actinobacteria bacterium]|nr:helix-turn-helix domain-containing protein [Actinomycetota bacterium]
MATAAVTERRPLMDLPTVAKYLGVSERHIRRLVQERRIPFIKWGHRLRFDPDEIDSWVDTKRVPCQPGSR